MIYINNKSCIRELKKKVKLRSQNNFQTPPPVDTPPIINPTILLFGIFSLLNKVGPLQTTPLPHASPPTPTDPAPPSPTLSSTSQATSASPNQTKAPAPSPKKPSKTSSKFCLSPTKTPTTK